MVQVLGPLSHMFLKNVPGSWLLALAWLVSAVLTIQGVNQWMEDNFVCFLSFFQINKSYLKIF